VNKDLMPERVANLGYLAPELPRSVYLLVEHNDLYQEVAGVLRTLPEIKVAGASPELFLEQAVKAEVILALTDNEATAYHFLHLVRRSLELCLRPLVLIAPEPLPTLPPPCFDGALTFPLTGFGLKGCLKHLEPLHGRLRSLPRLTEPLEERALREVNLLRFLRTRQVGEVIPQRDEHSPYGYSLPWADALLTVDRGQALLEMNHLTAAGLLLSAVEDVVNLCPQCGDFRLNFRQVCPHCSSPSLQRTRTIQHYACGQAAPETQFIHGDRYVCPKCGKELRHIGVDYGKPGEVVVCGHCGEISLEGELSCLCIKCGAIFPPLQARPFNVYRYRLSYQGEEAAAMGLHSQVSLNGVMDSFLNIYSYPFFEKYLSLEVKRSQRYQTPFSLINLTIGNLAEVESRLGVGGKIGLVKELEEIIGMHIRQTDLITFSPRHEILILLVGADADRAEAVMSRLLLKSRETLSFPLEFQYHLACVPHQARDLEELKRLLSPPESPPEALPSG